MRDHLLDETVRRSATWTGRVGVGVGAAVLAAAVAVTGCGILGGGADNTPSSQPTTSGSQANSSGVGKPGDALPKPAATTVIQVSGEAQISGEEWHPIDVVVAYYGIYRDGKYAKLLMGSWLQSGNDVPLQEDYQADLDEYLQFEHPIDAADKGSLSAYGLSLVDEQARKAHLVARDAEGKCLCPASVQTTPILTTLFTTTYAAPAEGTKAMTVYSNAGYAQNVPVFDGPLPSPDPSYVPPGRQLPTVYHETPAASGGPVKAQVIDVDASTSNLDLSVTEKKNKVSLAADVLFEFDKATLNAKGKARVAEAAAILKKKARGKVQVNGYTDAKGSDSYNLSLSQRRAVAVQKELQKHLSGTGITLAPKGYGEADPVAPNTIDGNDNPRGRKLNRRVEITYGS